MIPGTGMLRLLKEKLRLLHPTMIDVVLVDGEVEMQFSDGHPMITSEFVWGSETRNVLMEIENLLLDQD